MNTRRTIASLITLALPVLTVALPGVASAQEQPVAQPQAQAPAAQQTAPVQSWLPPSQPPQDGQAAAPQQVQQVQPVQQPQQPVEVQPTPTAPPPTTAPVYVQPAAGQWVETDAYGWIWVPAGSTSYEVSAQPYVYLYTPSYGWTWYVSPWGRGAYYAGPWVHARTYAWGAPHVWVHNAWIGGPRLRVGAPAAVHYGYGPRVVASPRVVGGGRYVASPHVGFRAPAAHASSGFRGARGGGGHHR